MLLRRLTLAIGILGLLAGISQIAFASWWVGVMPIMYATTWLTVFAIVAIIFGGVLVLAAAENVVAIRIYVLVIGLIMMAFASVIVLSPSWMQEYMNTLMLQRPHEFQINVVHAGGLLRVILSALLIYAATKAPAHHRQVTEPRLAH